MLRTAAIQKDILILTGILALSYVIIFLMSPKDIANYTVADIEYWGETGHRLMLKTSYEYNNMEDIKVFPKTLGDWKSFDFKYSDSVYKQLKADILLSRGYTKGDNEIVLLDIINSKVGASFHKQNICVKDAGWTIDNESTSEFHIANPPNTFTRLFANRLDLSKKDQKQVMIYWFMFRKFGSDNAVTMIRLSAPVINNDNTAAFDSMKSFIEGQLFNAMYERTGPENITIAEYMIREYGRTGMFAIALGILLPAGIVFYGIRRKD